MSATPTSRAVAPLAFTALGVVYGDIGTSPLYALRECFFGSHGVPPTPENVLGVLSLIVYALVVVISLKYVALVMRADNQGEGGILALTALVQPRDVSPPRSRAALVLLGIFGAALLYGDGMITPAITVLGAVEGLKIVTPIFDNSVVPLAMLILVAVFSIQRHGTDRVGRLFGPVMALWFGTLAVLGVAWVVRAPQVLWALDPTHAARFIADHGWTGFTVLGAVFLVVTGGEALYADMGHFGRRPVRLAWFAIVLPALLLNYFGQGALLLIKPQAAEHPFFELVPASMLVPLVLLATAAAIIASQALISGAFSLTRQAVQLGYAPRLSITHTSPDEMGQVYVPQINWLLALGTLAIVFGFGSSAALASAYGVAVALTMVITVVLLYGVARRQWRWSAATALVVCGVFLAIDSAFLAANLAKIGHGGWLPLVIGLLLATLMTTWKTGRRLIGERLMERALPYGGFLAAVAATPPARVAGTSVFLTAQPGGTPPALVHNVRYNKILHEHVIVLTLRTAQVPHVADAERLAIRTLRPDLHVLTAEFGFMEDPNVPRVLALAAKAGVRFDADDITYFLGRETVLATRRTGMAAWRERLFIVMARNAVGATAFFGLPTERVVELGVQVEV